MASEFVTLADNSIDIVLYTMIKVDDQLILKLETLARLQLSPIEREALKQDLESVLQMVDKLDEVDTDGVAPLLHIVDQSQLLREDEVKGQVTENQALLNAPLKAAPYFKVPKVIERP